MNRPTKRPTADDKWTPERIRRLRGHRTQEQFGKVLNVPKNTVWRWEAGYARPDRKSAQRLSKFAQKEKFLQDWKLAGSAVLLGDIEEASRHISRHFKIPSRTIAARWG
jgi:transcriptional regulator with XRE-family HTH domain